MRVHTKAGMTRQCETIRALPKIAETKDVRQGVAMREGQGATRGMYCRWGLVWPQRGG